MSVRSFYEDKQIQGYLRFVCLCVFLLWGGSLWMGIHTMTAVQTMCVTHDAAIASSLLEKGLSPHAVVAALDNQEITEAGQRLFAMLGRHEPALSERLCASSALYVRPFLPDWFAWQRRFFLYRTALAAVVWSLLLLGGTFVFLEKRRALYQQGNHVLRGYIHEDFSQRLPQNREGAIYHLFAYMEQFATQFAAKSQSEHQTKEFLKDMISDISHQLKTPLAALMMYQEIIANEPENVDTIRTFNAKMGSALQRMEQLILSLLKIARLDSGNITFEQRRYDVSEVIAYAVDTLTTRAKAEGKKIQIDGNTSVPLVCDGAWTAEAIGNIVKNALDHTQTGDSVRITWECSPAMLRIVIADNGSGIAPDDIPHIFKRFYRSRHIPPTRSGNSSRKRTSDQSASGVGLGLSLAKAIVEGQGGILSVQSQLAVGTTFTLSFRVDSSPPETNV